MIMSKPHTVLLAASLCVPLFGFTQVKPVTSSGVAPLPVAATTPNVGGSVTINNTSYVVSAKKQLATGVEFITMKPASANVKAATFLRTKNTYNATVFTQAQYTAFYSTGKLSSFGALEKVSKDGVDNWFVTTGSTIALFRTKKSTELEMVEVPRPTRVSALDNPPGGCTCCGNNGCAGCADAQATCSCKAIQDWLSCTDCDDWVNSRYIRCLIDETYAKSIAAAHILVTSKAILFR